MKNTLIASCLIDDLTCKPHYSTQQDISQSVIFHDSLSGVESLTQGPLDSSVASRNNSRRTSAQMQSL